MALNFADSIRLNTDKILRDVNDKVYEITLALFLSVVARTPSKINPGKFATGLLVNQWYPLTGGGYNSQLGTDTSPGGSGSISRIRQLNFGSAFLGKNGVITLSNSVDYAVRAERLGWPAPKWSGGKTGAGYHGTGGPYRMVQLALQEIAARYK